jgi:Ca2+/Na+ antiporter
MYVNINEIERHKIKTNTFWSYFLQFGIVFNISDAILGLTLLAWGNSIGGKSFL